MKLNKVVLSETYKDYKQITKIKQNERNIDQIDSEVFMELVNLEEIDLSHNEIKIVPKTTFKGLNKLKKINLSFNKIIQLHHETFKDLECLEEIDLSNNQLNRLNKLDKILFDQLKSLKTIYLHSNESLMECNHLELYFYKSVKYISFKTKSPKNNIELISNLTYDYKMNNANRGTALFIINYEFIENEKKYNKLALPGHDKQISRFEACCKKMGFTKIIILKNLTAVQIKEKLLFYATEDNTESDCFFSLFSSHGDQESFLSNDCKLINLSNLIQTIFAKAIINKPKLFFIDVCREAKQIANFSRFQQPDETIPNVNDFLIIYSMVDDHVSWCKNGTSRFIQTLTNVFEQEHENTELLDMIKQVNREIVILEGQIPNLNFSLRRNIKFLKKN